MGFTRTPGLKMLIEYFSNRIMLYAFFKEWHIYNGFILRCWGLKLKSSSEVLALCLVLL